MAISMKQLTSNLYHAPIPGNPWKNGVINVSTDVPSLPISVRQKQDKLATKCHQV